MTNSNKKRERIQHAMHWLDNQHPQMCDELLRWVAQNSWSRNLVGLQAMAGMLIEGFAARGIRLEPIELAEWECVDDYGRQTRQKTGPALVWHYQPLATRRVLLAIHYDTVYPPHTNATAELLHVRSGIDGDSVVPRDAMLRGPGVADAKGGIAVILWAMDAMFRFGLFDELGVSILLNPDEEIGSPASTELFQQLASQFEFALLFEPAMPGRKMAVDRKGTGNFTAVIHGRSAHAGRDLSQGRNALVQAARLAIEIDSWNQLSAEQVRCTGLQSGVTVNVGRMIGGGALNQVPDLATVAFNVRTSTPEGVAFVEGRMRELERNYSAEEGYSCSIQGRFHSPPKCVREDKKSIRLRQTVSEAASSLGQSLEWCDTGGACDGNKLAALGLPNVDTMGPIGGNLHSDAEYCDAASLLSATKLVVRILATLEPD